MYQPLWFERVVPIREVTKQTKIFKELWKTNGNYWLSRKNNFKNSLSNLMNRDLFKI